MQNIRRNVVLWVFCGALFACRKNAAPPVAASSQETVEKPAQERAYKTYSGAWFEIEYPSDFSVKGSEKSSTSGEGFDSALFTSPDGRVQFYVFAPQWHGQPKDIQLLPGERITAKSEEKKGNLTIKRWSVANEDQNFTRSFEETSDGTGPVNKIFGITYATPEDLEKYREEYLHFKSSLKQFAD